MSAVAALLTNKLHAFQQGVSFLSALRQIFARRMSVLCRENARKKDVRTTNIEAAKAVADAIRTSLGPRGMDKMVSAATASLPKHKSCASNNMLYMQNIAGVPGK